MIVARIAFSDPAMSGGRALWLDEHKAYLRSASIRILQSGPFLGRRHGAIVVAEVSSPSEMEGFSDGDPFVTNGIYKEVHIGEWNVTLSA
jgi:uncharacterized protein YciI